MFNDRLEATLTLVVGKTTLAIPAGAIEAISLQARTWGFSAEVTFWVSAEGVTDEVFGPLGSTEIVQARLALANGRFVLAGETPTVATFLGFVTDRSFSETVARDITGEPIIERRYTVRFSDAAQVFWREHRPLALYASQSYKEAIEANGVQGVTLTFEWPRLEEAQDIVCIGLGGRAAASFYDFVVWLVADLCGVMELDHATGTYRIAAAKADGADPTDLPADSVAEVRVEPPRLLRHKTTVQNPFSEATSPRTDVASSLAATGVRRDVTAHTPIASKVERRAQLEKARLRQRDHHLHVTFRELPPSFAAPGVKHTLGEGFSKRMFGAGKTYRSIALDLRAGPPVGEPDEADLEDATARFGVELSVELERDTDPVPNLPPYEAPLYPVLVEGKILSASGADTDRTWHALPGGTDSVIRYRVQIPLHNQKVVAPFVPVGESGHFFFPAYKDQRVLVALGLDSAEIVGFLDWAGRLATETQGNQIIMGKRDASSTVVKHAYTDDSPTLSVVRTQAGDKQTLEMSQGRFFLEVKEEEGQKEEEETANLTPQADAAKESADAKGRATIADLSGSFEAQKGTTKAALDGAVGEVDAKIGEASADLSAKAAEVDAAISDKEAELGAAAEELGSAAAAAKAELDAALGDD